MEFTVNATDRVVPMVSEPILTENATRVLEKRYLVRDEKGHLAETPRDMFERVARYVAQADTEYGEDPEASFRVFYAMMARRDFMPNTPCLANAGRSEGTGQLSACFVLPVEDSMESIMDGVKHAALIHKSGGGTGFAFSQLRPEGDYVKGTTGIASGPVSFMQMYDAMTEFVKQGGIRRGANMGILRIDHPDILKFIDLKRDSQRLQNFNISVAITNRFMEAREKGEDYELINPRTGLVVGRLAAREVWQKIVANAHFRGEPGLFFVDRVNELDPLSDALGPIEATNPCGEVPLRAYDACTLGSLNVGNFYAEKAAGNATVDFDRLGQTIRHGIHFLDNVLTVNRYPVPQIHDVTRDCRKIGLGVMGWADLLVKLGIRYDSDAATNLAEQLMRFISQESVKASEKLAEQRGPFPLWETSKWAKRGDKPRRNSTTTVIAPTGSISIIAGCSSGCEPLFAVAMVRNQAGMEMPDVHPAFVEIAKREGWYSDALMREVAEKGGVQDVDAVPPKWRDVFRTAMDISGEWHVRMQGAFQKYVEDGVSKTVNLPQDATVEQVDRAYALAWKLGCKGITVYRDKSRAEQTLNVGQINKTATEAAPERRVHGRQRRRGDTISKATAYGTVHVTINRHPSDDQPFECFIEMGKSGSEVKAMTEGLGRAISYLLSIPSLIPPKDRLVALADQFIHIGGNGSAGFGGDKIMSAPDGVAHAIIDYLSEDETIAENGSKRRELDICPECKQASLTKGGKCDLCMSCGYSKC